MTVALASGARLRQLFLQGAASAYLWMKRDRFALGITMAAELAASGRWFGDETAFEGEIYDIGASRTPFECRHSRLGRATATLGSDDRRRRFPTWIRRRFW